MKAKEFINELRGLSLEDVKEKRRSLSEELMKLRFRKAVGQLDRSHRISEVKRNIARVVGVLSEKTQAQ